MIPQDLNYLLPNGAYLLFVVPFIFIAFWILFHYRKAIIAQFFKGSDQNELLVSRPPAFYWAKVAAFCLAWIFATFALMQPRGNGHYPESHNKKPAKSVLQRKAHDFIFLIDASASMAVEDSRERKSRLNSAKDIADEIASHLTGESASLFAFTSETTQLSPPTQDYFFVRMMMRQIQINEGGVPGTDFVTALTKMRKDFFSQEGAKLKTLVLLSDGGDTYLETLSEDVRKQQIDNIANLIGNAENENLRVFTVGIGSSAGGEVPKLTFAAGAIRSALEPELLKKISSVGRGNYYSASDYSAIDIAGDIARRVAVDNPYLDEDTEIRKQSAEQDLIYDLYFQIPLGLALLCLGFALVCPDSKTVRRSEPVEPLRVNAS